MAIPVYIAVEDDLSEAVLRRLLEHVRRTFTVRARYPLRSPGRRAAARATGVSGLSGYGYLKKNLRAFNHAAAKCPQVILTDLDVHAPCPGGVLPLWLSPKPHPNLVFRVAVPEVEAWLIADAANFADYLGVSPSAIPANVELLSDPKSSIVNLASGSRYAEIKADLVPVARSTSTVGRYFSRSLLNFARNRWEIDEATKRSRSLAKAIQALSNFKPVS